jgi:hypothetical protein
LPLTQREHLIVHEIRDHIGDLDAVARFKADDGGGALPGERHTEPAERHRPEREDVMRLRLILLLIALGAAWLALGPPVLPLHMD